MKHFILFIVAILAQQSHSLEANNRRWLICTAFTMEGPIYQNKVALKESSEKQIADCKQSKYCGSKKENYLIQDNFGSKATFVFGRYEVRVSVLVDYSIRSLKVLDTAKGISMITEFENIPEFGDNNITDQGHDAKVFIYQVENELPSYQISCRVVKEKTFNQ